MKPGVSERSAKRTERVDETVAELALVGPHPTDPNRNALGRYAKDNNGHLSIGTHSEKRWAALQSALRDEHARILEAKGFTEEDADPVMSKVVDGFNQAVVMMNSYFDFLASTGGPISVKGRTRRAVEGWSRAADRVAKFAQMIGLEKRARRVHAHETVREFLDRERAEREHDTPDTHDEQHAEPAENA